MQYQPTDNIAILVIEDDPTLNQQLVDLLTTQGYRAQGCLDGETGLLTASQHTFQLILLDVMLPKLDGFSLLNMLRKTRQTPVIMLTAKDAEQERITGLRQGADDYISKPFNSTELLLRIEALLRRVQANQPPSCHHLTLDRLTLNKTEQLAHIDTQTLDLTPNQFNLLWELVLHKGTVLSKAYLSQQALNRTLGAYDRGLDMHLSRVRRKLTEAGWQGERLQTVYGQGYCLK